ncbi:MAG TPA: cytochrome c oxidase assembly protein [Candidatus Aquilonibacter sp.]|nr:cytochrome c oxidase assembly protein [Candidatus Aquilonibacter sp.]
MTTTRLLLTAWDFDWSVILGCVLILMVYFLKGRADVWQRISFAAGVFILFLSLQSPLDPLGDTYLFSAHMAQHLLLILLVPPLLVLGISETEARSWLKIEWIVKAERVLGNPYVAWCAGVATMTVWHVPTLYNFALAHEPAHIFQHLSFLVTATIFWWPVLHPLPERRLHTGAAVAYLFAAAAENSVLGIILTFMPVGHYPAYLHPKDDLGALNLIRDGWGISAAQDQRLGGLLMWVPGCSVYFVAILAIIGQWYARPDSEEDLGSILTVTERGLR